MRQFPLRGRQVASLLCAGIGLCVMLAVLTGHREWLRLIPQSSLPVFNMGVLQVLCAGMLWFHPAQRHPLTSGTAVAMIGFSTLLLLQTVLDVDLGLDAAGLHTDAPPHVPPGRVSVQACIGLISASLAVLLQRYSFRPALHFALTGLLVFITVVTAMAALVGYALGLDAMYELVSRSRMSLLTSIATMIVAAALWRTLLKQHEARNHNLDENRITGSAVAVLGVIAVSSGLVTFSVIQTSYRGAAEGIFEQMARSHATAMAHNLEQDIEMSAQVATQLAVRRVLDRANQRPDDPDVLLDLKEVGDSLVPLGFNALILEAANGRPLLTLGTTHGLNPSRSHELPLARPDARLFWREGVIMLRVRTMVTHQGRTLGTLITETRLAALTQVLGDMRSRGRTSDVLLCGRTADTVVCLPSRHHPNGTALPMFSDANAHLSIMKALKGQRGSEMLLDARKVSVQAGYSPVGSLGLALVVKMNIEELYAPLRSRMYVVAAVLLVMIAAGAWMLRMRVHPLAEKVVSDQRRMRDILATSQDAFVATDPKGRITDWNEAAERMFGWSRQEAIGQMMNDLITPPEFKAIHTPARFRDAGTSHILDQRLELRASRKNGEEFPIELALRRIGTDGTAGFAAFLTDISVRMEARQALQAQEKRLRTITDNLPVLISYIDRDHRLMFGNGTFRRWLGIDTDEAMGRPLVEVVGEALYSERKTQIDRAMRGERVDFEIKSTVGERSRHLQTMYLPDIQPDGTVAGIYTLSNDVSALKEIEQQLRHLARFDTLTGLANRLQLEEKLPEAIARSRRAKRACAVMFLDIDKFKAINDSLGHGGGDDVLKEFALRLSGCVRQTDTVARLAGDEFVIVLEGLNSPDEPDLVARKIISCVNAPFTVAGQPLQVSTSLGIAYFDRQDLSSQDLLALADAALYEAKKAGRNTYRWAPASTA